MLLYIMSIEAADLLCHLIDVYIRTHLNAKFCLKTYRHTDIQTYRHTDRQTWPGPEAPAGA